MLCFYSMNSFSCPQGFGSSCAMQFAQDCVCKILCEYLYSPACGLLGKVFILSCCYFGVLSSQEAFPEKAEGERNCHGSDGSVPAYLPCSPWTRGNFLISGRPDWVTDCREQKFLPLYSTFLLLPVTYWVMTQDRMIQDTLHLQLRRCINSFHLSLKHKVLATKFDLQLNGKSYSIFPGPQEW